LRARRRRRQVVGQSLDPADVRDVLFLGDPPALGEHVRIGIEADHLPGL
jgi:hypothetical protein